MRTSVPMEGLTLETSVILAVKNGRISESITLLANKELKDAGYELTFEQRKILHIAGVFVSNFMNHSVFLGQKLLQENNIPISILNPLLRQSFAKIINGDAYSSQTGPAVRGDRKVVESHIDMLSSDEKLAEIYKIMSESIIKTYCK